MRLIHRHSRRFTPRMVEFTYPELRSSHQSSGKKGLLERAEEVTSAENTTRARGSRR